MQNKLTKLILLFSALVGISKGSDYQEVSEVQLEKIETEALLIHPFLV